MKRIIFLSVLALVLLVSCSESTEDILKSRKEDAVKKFDQFYRCYAIAQKTPPVSKDEIAWKERDVTVKYKESNVYQISYENFKDLSKALEIPYDGTRRKEHADMAHLFGIDLSSHKEKHTYKEQENYIYQDPSNGEPCRAAVNHFLDSKYLLINRTTEYQEPEDFQDDMFVPGYVKGDVLVFDLNNAELLGGFTYFFENSQTVSIGASGVDANIKSDLKSKVYNGIKEKFKNLTIGLDSSFDF